jgi:putative hydrolase of the HAD superfamily
MIRGIIFDLDQTLINRSATFKRFIDDQFDRFSQKMHPTTQISYWEGVSQFDNNGYTKKFELYSKVCEFLDINITPSELFDDFKDKYGLLLVLFDGISDELKSLKSNYSLGLISTGRSKAQRAKIGRSGLEPSFDVIKISEEVGIKKPDLRIFEHCVEALCLKAHECAYIGDHPQNDVIASMNLGMKGIWLRNSHFQAPENCDGVINCLEELPELLNSLNTQSGIPVNSSNATT